MTKLERGMKHDLKENVKTCVKYNLSQHFCQKFKEQLHYKAALTLPLPRRGGGGGGGQPTAKGLSSITFEQNKLETSNFA